MKNQERRNRFSFGIGTLGRDMVNSMITMYLIFYLTDIIRLPESTLWWITAIILFSRIFDALNDPVMGMIVDNTRHRWGKFKPWIARGALAFGSFSLLLFTDFKLQGPAFVIVFFILYLGWGISYTANDIAYWSMLPALSVKQKQREKIGAFARIWANIGLFTVVVGLIPITGALEQRLGSSTRAYFVFVLVTVIIMLLGQSVTFFGVKEPKGMFREQPHTPLKEMFRIILGNDQLLWIMISLALFMTGYLTTTSFGLYFFKYIYGDERMYSLFAAVLGVSQLAALLLFPLLSKKIARNKLFTLSLWLILSGYLLFFFSPMNMFFLGPAGVLIFGGEGLIQILMMMFITDTVEYGHWKLGTRNESITYSLQPFIYKIGGAVSSGVVGAIVILSGISAAEGPEDLLAPGKLLIKAAMILFPMTLILLSYLIHRKKYVIDSAMYHNMLKDLKTRGELEKIPLI